MLIKDLNKKTLKQIQAQKGYLLLSATKDYAPILHDNVVVQVTKAIIKIEGYVDYGTPETDSTLILPKNGIDKYYRLEVATEDGDVMSVEDFLNNDKV